MGSGAIPKKKDKWEHPQFNINITEKYPDGAYQIVQLAMSDLPGVVAVGLDGKIEISLKHSFHFFLPRDYPQSLGKIKIVNETPLFHPRMAAAGTNACYTVNGEVDRVLVDLIYNVLLRPETIKPPNLFRDADWGLNVQKMKWYIQYGPQKIYDYLKNEWAKQQKKIGVPGNAGVKKVRVID